MSLARFVSVSWIRRTRSQTTPRSHVRQHRIARGPKRDFASVRQLRMISSCASASLGRIGPPEIRTGQKPGEGSINTTWHWLPPFVVWTKTADEILDSRPRARRFYSYTWLESLIGADIRNVDQLTPGLPARRAGDTVWMGPRDRFRGMALKRWTPRGPWSWCRRPRAFCPSAAHDFPSLRCT
jgi:hypothetical protein